MEQLIAHLIGDYLLQNDWMALNKKKYIDPAFIHAFIYTMVFQLMFDLNVLQFFVIFITHFIIDHTDIVVKFLTYRNRYRYSKLTSSNFGFSLDRPQYIAFWLYVITDNAFHLIINYLTLRYLCQ